MQPIDSAAKPTSKSGVWLLVCAFLSGALVMLVEVLGTRVIAPVFGAGLFVWAAQLSVALCALAAGYYAGGALVDRQPRARILGYVLLAAGLFLSAVPASSPVVLRAAAALGPMFGPLASAFALFAPPLAALGMTGPIVIRLHLASVLVAGHRAGFVYALSTLGSLVGTLATAFWLIPTFETSHTLFGAAGVLLLGGGSILFGAVRGLATLGLGAPGILLSSAFEYSLPQGISIAASAQSQHGLVQVVDDSTRGVRFLRVDHSIIGAEFTRDGSSAFGFLHQMEAARFARPHASEVLIVGLGVGSLPQAWSAFGLESDVVEISPDVARFAQSHFGFVPSGEVYMEDARTLLARTERRYDIIVHDTFSGGAVPEHLLSVEVIERMRELLRPEGLVVLNFVGYHSGPSAVAAHAVTRTLRSAFAHVRAFADRALNEEPESMTNLVFFASPAPIDFELPRDYPFHNTACEQVLRTFQAWEVFESVPDGSVITDRHNPLGQLQSAATAAHFDAMNELLPIEVWLAN